MERRTWMELVRRYGLAAAYGASAILALAIALALPAFSLPAHSVAAQYPETLELAHLHLDAQHYTDYFRALAQKKGAVYAYDVLRNAPIPSGTDVHSVGHVIGDILYTQKGIAGIEYCTQEFRNACSHSIVIGFLEDHGVSSLSEIADACDRAPGGKAGFSLCFHGVGHGVLAYTGYDLKKSVALCKLFGTPRNSDEEYRQCVGGTIMEMLAGSHDPIAWHAQQANYFKASDPLYPCDADWMPDEVRGSCYLQLTPRLFQAAGGTMSNPSPSVFPRAFGFCAAIPNDRPDDRRACYAGFGKELVPLGHDLRDLGTLDIPSLTTIRDWCALAHDADGIGACDSEVLGTLFWGGEQSADAAFRFCQIATDAEAPSCYEQLATQIQYYVGPNRAGAALCARLPERYQATCQSR